MGLRESKKEKTLELILVTAESLLRTRGYDSLSIEDIASQAQISRKTIYNYIRTKEDIVVKIVDKRLEKWLNNTSPHAEWKIPAKDKFVYIHRNLAKEFKNEKKLWKEIIPVTGFNYVKHASQRSIVRNLAKCFKEIIMEGQKAGTISKKYKADVLSNYIISIQIQLCIEWVMNWPSPGSLSRRLQDIVNIFLIGING